MDDSCLSYPLDVVLVITVAADGVLPDPGHAEWWAKLAAGPTSSSRPARQGPLVVRGPPRLDITASGSSGIARLLARDPNLVISADSR